MSKCCSVYFRFQTDSKLVSEYVLRAGSNSAKSSNDFETTGQILMKLGHNDHLVMGIRIYTWIGAGFAKSSNNFSETTGHNDHQLGSEILLEKGWGQIVF